MLKSSVLAVEARDPETHLLFSQGGAQVGLGAGRAQPQGYLSWQGSCRVYVVKDKG